MIVTPVLDHGIELGQNAPGYVRGAGLHMSTLYNAMYETLEPKRFDKSKPIDKNRLEAGMAWEEILERAIVDRVGQLTGTGRPDEMVEPEHGIIYSPDLLIFNHVMRVGEIKLTWLSSSEVPRVANGQFPPKFNKYFTQMKLYCYCLQTPYARLMAFFVNGTYNHYRGGDPEFLVWDVEFTPRELREEWQTVIGFGKSKGLIV